MVAKYAEEIELERLLYGYDLDMLLSVIEHFCTAPLTVIDQGNGTHCIIVNNSYPKNKHCI